jgi:hypothetical protein
MSLIARSGAPWLAKRVLELYTHRRLQCVAACGGVWLDQLYRSRAGCSNFRLTGL